MQIKLISSILVGCVAAAAAAAHRPSSRRAFVSTSKTMAMNDALSIRGGAGPLPVEATAKVFTGITSVQGALDYLSAKTVNKLYNIDLSDDISSFLQKYVGGNQAAVAIMLFATVFSDVVPLKAIGYGLVPGVLTHISSLLDQTPKEIGINVPMQYMNAAINAFVIKSLLGGADNAATILKYFLAYTGLATGQCRVAPDAALKVWGFQKGTANQTFATKLIGQSGLAMTAVAYALGVQGASASTAVGYAAVVYFASVAEFLLSGEFEAIGCDITKCYPWLVISLATASTLLM